MFCKKYKCGKCFLSTYSRKKKEYSCKLKKSLLDGYLYYKVYEEEIDLNIESLGYPKKIGDRLKNTIIEYKLLGD